MFSKHVIMAMKCGSRVTCDPPPMDSDDDILLLVDNVKQFCEMVQGEGYSLPQPYIPGSCFQSLRKGEINLIVTSCPIFFGKFRLATKVAKQLNLLKKQDRVALFQAILYGK